MGRMTLASVSVFLAIAFAGCTGDSTPEASPPESSSTSADGNPANGTVSSSLAATSVPDASSSTATATATGSPSPSSPPPGSDEPPLVTLEANVTTGSTPLSVSFSANASDPEGAALAWSFDADGDGRSESQGDASDWPPTFIHEYASEGNFTANFTVSDGTHSVSATVVMVVAPGGPAPPACPAEPFALRLNQYYVLSSGQVWEDTNGIDGVQTKPADCPVIDTRHA